MNALFEIGQKVVCVDSKSVKGGHGDGCISTALFLIEGKEYTVRSINPCKCGVCYISVGIPTPNPLDVCFNCGFEKSSIGYRLHNQTRFVPLDFDRQADEEIKSALNESLKVKL